MAVGGVARVLSRIFGDGFGVHRGEPCDQTLPAVLIPVHCHKASNAVEDTGQEGIGIAPPCLHDDLQGFLIDVRTVVLINIIGRADAVDLPLGSDAIQCKSSTSCFGGCNKCTGILIFCHDVSTKPLTCGQIGGNARLNSKQKGFILFGKAVKDFAEDREVMTSVAGDTSFDGVLTIKNMVATITVADSRFVGNVLRKGGRDLLHLSGAQNTLVFSTRSQECAVDVAHLANTFGQLGKVQIRNHHSTLSFIV